MRMSNMDRLHACPASEIMEARYPDTTTPQAERGTRLHKLCEDHHKTGKCNFDGVPDEDKEEVAWALLNAEVLTKGFETESEVELEVHGVPGHADLIGIDGKRGIVIDYKFGQWPVSTEGNWQLKSYACGLAMEHDLDEVEVGIVQPATQQAFTIKYGKEELYEIANEIGNLASLIGEMQEGNEEVLKQNPPTPGEHCSWCKARGVCEMRLKLIEQIPNHMTVTDAVNSMTVAERGELMVKMDQVAKWITEAKEEMAKNGVDVDGYRLTSMARKYWAKDADIESLGEEAFKREPITPAQALKKFGDKVEPMIETKDSKPFYKRGK